MAAVGCLRKAFPLVRSQLKATIKILSILDEISASMEDYIEAMRPRVKQTPSCQIHWGSPTSQRILYKHILRKEHERQTADGLLKSRIQTLFDDIAAWLRYRLIWKVESAALSVLKTTLSDYTIGVMKRRLKPLEYEAVCKAVGQVSKESGVKTASVVLCLNYITPWDLGSDT
jgi:hypothetical protein